MEDPKCYRVFVRNWWQRNPAWKPLSSVSRRTWQNGGLIPDPGARKTTLARNLTYTEARAMCEEHAKTHKPGPLSRKAEFQVQ